MEDLEYFYTIAEIAVTLAGFSGIVVALIGRGAAWRENDRYGLLAVLVACAGAFVLALVPACLLFFELSGSVVWSITAALIGIFMLGGSAAFARVRRRMEPRLETTFWITVILTAAFGLGLGFEAVMVSAGSGLVALALLWLLVLAFMQLGTFLVAAASGHL